MKRKTVKEVHQERMQDSPEYAADYDALEKEFSIVSELINIRKQANLTQAELAAKMQTMQAQIARMEGGKLLSMRAL